MIRIPAVAALWFALALSLQAAEKIPPKPAGYFNDYAGVVSKDAALRFNEQLAQFERETSNQIVVAVFKKMESDSSIEDYTRRVAEAWRVGQKEQRNGAVLFVFVEDRKMFIQVGYGLEGAITDLTAYDITERRIKPRFRANDYEGGLTTGIDLICKAARGEYTGSGKTKTEEGGAPANGRGFLTFFIFLVILLFAVRLVRRVTGYGYSSAGGRPFYGGWMTGSGGGWSGGSSSGSSGGGFSGFSGGGGSFGGGGAGSSW